jgi:hypothetical protein
LKGNQLTDYGVSGTLNMQGDLIQYSTFRNHSGIGYPAMMLDYWNNDNTSPHEGYVRFGLRNGSGSQVGPSLQFEANQYGVWKSFAYTPAGQYALNGRSEIISAGQNPPYTITWAGHLRLS